MVSIPENGYSAIFGIYRGTVYDLGIQCQISRPSTRTLMLGDLKEEFEKLLEEN